MGHAEDHRVVSRAGLGRGLAQSLDLGFESALESALGALLLESDVDELLLVDEDDELESSLFGGLLFARFEGPEYRSDSQPPPFKMKLPPAIIRRALSLPHSGHFLMGSSVMRCSRSNS